MSLLQDPKKVLEQIDWYIENKELEKFPGAFFISAGNLCRQLIEQVIFIISFYGDLPKEKYITSDDKIKTPFIILNALKEKYGQSNMTYIDRAISRGKRIEKFADKINDFDNWRKLFNEPSHFRNPMRVRQMEEEHIIEFVSSMKEIIDNKDCHLLTAAINEIKSEGKIKAVLSNDKDNTPGLSFEIILGPNNVFIENKSIKIKYNKLEYYVVPDDEEIPYKTIDKPIIIQHSEGIALNFNMINKYGDPINLTNMKTIMTDICKTREDCIELKNNLEKCGVTVKIDSLPKIDIIIN